MAGPIDETIFNKINDSATSAEAPCAYRQDTIPARKRRQRRSCDQCRRGKRACDAGDSDSLTAHTCTNCLRKNQCCTFNWLKTASNPRQSHRREQRHAFLRNHHSCSKESVDSQNGTGCTFTNTGNSQHYSNSGAPSSTLSNFHGLHGLYANDPSGCCEVSLHDCEDDCGSRHRLSDALAHSRPRKSLDWRSLHSPESEWDWCGAPLSEQDQASFNVSPSTGRSLGDSNARSTMTHSLLRIYHDSMENALSCWLTEHNCPYLMSDSGLLVSGPSSATREWGSSWSNRMYNRVIQLDRAYSTIRPRMLTAEEERTASKALNMSIVAFASQWAQAGERGTRRPTESGVTRDGFPVSNDFERSMQESLWHQTSQLLYQSATIDSFRVVFALIIFSLTQRPLDMTRPAPQRSKANSGYETFQALVQDEDAPVFLEIALRQLVAQRRKLERRGRRNTYSGSEEFPKSLRMEDRATFNLLYWLGVMFDTLSAATCQRAVVVSDNDCSLPRLRKDPGERDNAAKAGNSGKDAPQHYPFLTGADFDMPSHTNAHADDDQEVWGDLFIRTGSQHMEPKAARWPCSYKLAALTLSAAAPVKVLLFRRVAQLQALVSQRASAVQIEAAIKAAFHVYNHWHRMYNPFITDCVKHHDDLPARVQSWYTLLAGHWHLATFLLSDLLETVDSTHLSPLSERLSRQISNLVPVLRRQNALAVADLSRSSIHGSLGEAPDFHFALNEAALLTEPWTVVFVRSLCRAGYILANLTTTDVPEQERRESKQRCDDCIEGLWYLGRKSDMAYLAARALSEMLAEAKVTVPAPKVLNLPINDACSAPRLFGLDTCNNPEDRAETAQFPQTFDLMSAWAVDGSIQDGSLDKWLPECGDESVHQIVGTENFPLMDIASQEYLWGC
ncbi:hypothetical protein BKA63DRAFT_485043 [Paraphoma chrysanthemicola]|nr:hypothetical protein BKA63DRAFT_485043 [Paraphoma chrysanthemicola]